MLVVLFCFVPSFAREIVRIVREKAQTIIPDTVARARSASCLFVEDWRVVENVANTWVQ